MGRWHAETARKLGARVVGVVDTDANAARRLAAQFRGARVFTAVEELFLEDPPAVVHVCTPLPSHVAVCRAVLERGAHVVCEKPLAPTAEQTRTLLAHAREARKSVCPVHQFAAQEGVLKAKRLLPELGTLSGVRFAICSAGAEGADAAGRDAVVADILPHPLSVIASLWPQTRLENLAWDIIKPAPGEAVAHCLIGAVPMSFAISMSGRPTRCAMELQGSLGSLCVDFFHGYCVRFPGTVSRLRKIAYPFTDSARTFTAAAANLARRIGQRELAYPGLAQLFSRFYAELARGTADSAADDVTIAIASARDAFMLAMR